MNQTTFVNHTAHLMSVDSTTNKKKLKLASGYVTKRDSRTGHQELSIETSSHCDSSQRYNSRSARTAAQFSSRLAAKYSKEIRAGALAPSISFGNSRETFAGPY